MGDLEDQYGTCDALLQELDVGEEGGGGEAKTPATGRDGGVPAEHVVEAYEAEPKGEAQQPEPKGEVQQPEPKGEEQPPEPKGEEQRPGAKGEEAQPAAHQKIAIPVEEHEVAVLACDAATGTPVDAAAPQENDGPQEDEGETTPTPGVMGGGRPKGRSKTPPLIRNVSVEKLRRSESAQSEASGLGRVGGSLARSVSISSRDFLASPNPGADTIFNSRARVHLAEVDLFDLVAINPEDPLWSLQTAFVRDKKRRRERRMDRGEKKEAGMRGRCEQRRELRRRKVLQDLFETEAAFLAEMQKVVDLFLMPLTHEKLLTPQQSASVFGNFLDVMHSSTRLRDELKVKIDGFHPLTTCIGDTVLNITKDMEAFVIYAANHNRMTTALTTCCEGKVKLQKFLSEAETTAGHTLPELLAMPMAHFGKMSARLRSLYALTKADHVDENDLLLATRIVQIKNNSVAASALLGERIRTTADVVTRISGLKDSPFNDDSLLLHQGPVVAEVSADGQQHSYTKANGVLFNNVLLITTANKDKVLQQKVSYFMPIEKNVSVMAHYPSDATKFTLARRGAILSLHAPTEDAKKEWCTKVAEALQSTKVDESLEECAGRRQEASFISAELRKWFRSMVSGGRPPVLPDDTSLENPAPGQVLLLTGQQGVGLSALFQETARLVKAHGMDALVCDANLSMQMSPMAMWRTAVARVLGLGISLRGLKRELVRTAYVEVMQRAGEDSASIEEHLPLLNTILGVEFADTAATSALDPFARVVACMDLISKLLYGAALARPTVVLITNGQWMPTQMWEALEELALRRCTPTSKTPRPRLGLVIATRPCDFDLRHLQTIGSMLEVGPVTLEGTGELVSQVLGTAACAPNLATLIHTKSKGMPILILELCQMMAKEGTVEVQSGVARLNPSADMASFDFVDSFGFIARKRIEALSKRQLSIVKVAAVAGVVFLEEVLYAVAKGLRVELEGDVKTLIASGFFCDLLGQMTRADSGAPIERTAVAGEGDAAEVDTGNAGQASETRKDEVSIRQLSFANQQMQDFVYKMLSEDERKGIHSAVAHWSEEMLGKGYSITNSFLGFQFMSAGLPQKALLYNVKAGQDAALRHDNDKAAILFETSLNSLKLLRTKNSSKEEYSVNRAKILLMLAKVQLKNGRAMLSYDNLCEAMVLLGDEAVPMSSDVSKEKTIFASRGSKALMKTKMPTEATTAGIGMEDAINDASRVYLRSEAMREVARFFFSEGHRRLAMLQIIKSLDTYEQTGLCYELGVVYALVAHGAALYGKNDVTERFLSMATECTKACAAPASDTFAMQMIYAITQFMRGNIRDALRLASAVRMQSSALGDKRMTLEALSLEVLCLYLKGEINVGEKLAETMRQLSKTGGDVQMQSAAARALAIVKIDGGDMQSAVMALTLAKDFITDSYGAKVSRLHTVTINGLLAQGYYRLQQYTPALQCVTSTMAALAECDVRDLGADTVMVPLLGMMEALLGVLEATLSISDRDKAQEESVKSMHVMVKDANAVLESLVKLCPFADARVHAYQGWYLILKGKHSKAKSELEKARMKSLKKNEKTGAFECFALDEAIVYYLLYKNFLAQGQMQDASAFLDAVIKLFKAQQSKYWTNMVVKLKG